MTEYIDAHHPTEDMIAAREYSKTNGGNIVRYAIQGHNEYWFKTLDEYNAWNKLLPNTVRANTHKIDYQHGKKITRH
jgi:hypothetical protein